MFISREEYIERFRLWSLDVFVVGILTECNPAPSAGQIHTEEEERLQIFYYH